MVHELLLVVIDSVVTGSTEKECVDILPRIDNFDTLKMSVLDQRIVIDYLVSSAVFFTVSSYCHGEIVPVA